jgi:hypothetical protein
MTPEQFSRQLEEMASEINEFVNDVAPELAGDIAVNHFKENFEKEGFVNNGVQPWAQVERRKPQSPWYGYKYGSKTPSPTRANDKILHDTGELHDSIEYDANGDGTVTVTCSEPPHCEKEETYFFRLAPAIKLGYTKKLH